MTEEFVTPPVRSLLRRLRLFLSLVGFMLLLLGIGRVALESLGGLSDLAETFNPALFSTATFVMGIGYALVGYLALYAFAAIGAMEPPALSAIRTSLLAIGFILWVTVIWGVFTGTRYALITLVLALLGSLLIYWFGVQVERRVLWQVFGQPIPHRSGNHFLLILVSIIGMVIMIALGIIYAILTDVIEIPLSTPAAGQLLYVTTFDKFNDEWDLPRGRQSADIVDGELILKEATGVSDSAFYARLDSRKFRDFDLRVRTEQKSGPDDNSYGVIFRWKDFDNYFRFEISGDGYYRLSKTKDGVTEGITQWTPSDLIHQGAAPNEINIIAQKATFHFFINQQPALLCTKGENREPLIHPLTGECISNDWQESYTDDDLSQGKIGLTAGTTQGTDATQPVVVGFDNLILVGPS